VKNCGAGSMPVRNSKHGIITPLQQFWWIRETKAAYCKKWVAK